MLLAGNSIHSIVAVRMSASMLTKLHEVALFLDYNAMKCYLSLKYISSFPFHETQAYNRQCNKTHDYPFRWKNL